MNPPRQTSLDPEPAHEAPARAPSRSWAGGSPPLPFAPNGRPRPRRRGLASMRFLPRLATKAGRQPKSPVFRRWPLCAATGGLGWPAVAVGHCFEPDGRGASTSIGVQQRHRSWRSVASPSAALTCSTPLGDNLARGSGPNGVPLKRHIALSQAGLDNHPRTPDRNRARTTPDEYLIIHSAAPRAARAVVDATVERRPRGLRHFAVDGGHVVG